MRITIYAILCVLVSASASPGQSPTQVQPDPTTPALDRRWVFSFGYRRNRDDVEKIKSLVDTAAAHGLNGMVLASFGLDGVTQWTEEDHALLREVAAHCEKRQIELIPTGFGTGYGGTATGFNRSFSAALPVAVSLVARDGKLLPVSGENLLVNGDLADRAGNRFADYTTQDQPGEVSFADPDVADGKTAIRFGNFTSNEHGHGRLAQDVVIRAGRTYRFSFKAKTRDLRPANRLSASVLADGRALARVRPGLKRTQDWTEVTLDFISTIDDTVSLYTGIWRGRSGTFWLSDLDFREYGMVSDIVRRKGTPVELRSLDRDRVYVEGLDFEPIECKAGLDHLVLMGSAIREGERLALSCYRIPYVAHPWGKQLSLCMSNPALYDHWEAQARALHKAVPFKRVLLTIDEVRNGGGCALCQGSGTSMAQIVGDCLRRERDIFKAIDPSIEVTTWSDMYDPAHNAVDNYYGVVGDFTGAADYAPTDVTMVCWYHKIRDESLGFFSSRGFPTMGAAYYDADDLEGSRDWLESLRKTPNSKGIMYTAWERKYELLGAFGDLVSEAAQD